MDPFFKSLDITFRDDNTTEEVTKQAFQASMTKLKAYYGRVQVRGPEWGE